MFNLNYRLMDEAGGEGGEGGGAAGGTSADNWRDMLSDDLKEDKSLADFTDVNSLAKSYVNARSMIGKDTYTIPETDEQWNDLYGKLGRPEEATGYELNTPEGFEAEGNPILDSFRGVLHQAGLNQNQTNLINDWYWNTLNGVQEDNAQAQENAYDDSVAALQQAWGEKFDTNLALANRTIDTLGGEEFANYLESKGLYNDPQMVQFLFNVSKLSSEDGQLEMGNASPGALTPAEIQDKINELMAEPAYADKMNPNHKSTVDKVQKLFGRLHGAQ